MNKNIHRGIAHLALLVIIGLVVLGGIYGATNTDLAYSSRSLLAAAYGYFDSSPRIVITRNYWSPSGEISSGTNQKLALFNVVSVNSNKQGDGPFTNYLNNVVASVTVTSTAPELRMKDLSMVYVFCNDAAKGGAQPCTESILPVTVTVVGSTYTLTSTSVTPLNLFPDVRSSIVVLGTPIYVDQPGTNRASVTSYINSATGSNAVDATLAGGSTLSVKLNTETPPPVALSVVSPNGGETWAAGSTQTLKWSGGAINWPVNIFLLDSTKTKVVKNIESSRANSGATTWSVPTTVPTGSYYLRVACQGCPSGTAGWTDDSNASFSIVGTTTPVTGPDLTANITTVSSTTAYGGQPITFSGSINNTGAGGATNIPSVFRIMNAAGLVTYTRLSAGTLASIAAGSSNVSVTNATYSTTTPGTYIAALCANMSTTGTVPANSVEPITAANNNCGPAVYYNLVAINPPTVTLGIADSPTAATATKSVPGIGTQETGTFTFTFNVTAVGGDIYLSSTTNAFMPLTVYTSAGVATTTGAYAITSSAARSAANNYVIYSGQTKAVTITLAKLGQAGYTYAKLLTLKYGASEQSILSQTATFSSQYQTSPIYLAD